MDNLIDKLNRKTSADRQLSLDEIDPAKSPDVFQAFKEDKARGFPETRRFLEKGLSDPDLVIQPPVINFFWQITAKGLPKDLVARASVHQALLHGDKTITEIEGSEMIRIAKENEATGSSANQEAILWALASLTGVTIEYNPEIARGFFEVAEGLEKENRFVSAVKMYEVVVTNYPGASLAGEALFRAAANYERVFEFDKAVLSYQRLATDPRFKGSPYRTKALYNAAVILENDRAYNDAAKVFQQYASDPLVNKKDAAEAFFRSALLFQKDQYDQKAPRKAHTAYSQFLSRYGDKSPLRAIEARFRIAQACESENKHKEALEQYRMVVKIGASVEPGSDAAEFAAQAAFALAERMLPGLEGIKIKGGGREFQRSVEQMKDRLKQVKAAYEKLIHFKRGEWTSAALYRQGSLYELFSKALLSAPCPPEVKKLGPETCDLFTQQIQQLVEGVDAESLRHYRQALEFADKDKVSNRWTDLALDRAHHLKPDEFPVFHDPKIEMRLDDP